ncbi:2-phospho-L-lactate guanylyltransferase [Halobacteriales archaeon QS_1_68_20]|nr:MAG: 2-phospho-L-lactate guanylyltransferase [Halobacteriales archaeon QS_1_68_20]
MRVVVPFAAGRPKTRLADVLDAEGRASFARVMLRDVLDAVRAADRRPEVLATAPVDVGAPVTVDERPLTGAVNAVLAETDGPVAVVMADLALATGRVLRELFETDGDVVVAPGRGGGTNALVVRHDEFRVDYHGASYLDHLAVAREVGASVAEFDSHRLSTDVDEPTDLPEVLLHGEGDSPGWLRSAGFRLAVEDGRVEVTRPE